MRITHRVMLIAVGIAALQSPVLATKPCLPSPCETTGGTIDRAKCQRLADWIVTGTITSVVHHEQGYPLLKDFAEFTFTVQTWEKGNGKIGREFRFQVGWCENSQPLPKDTSAHSGSLVFPYPRTLPSPTSISTSSPSR
jgi:hypothetical protein